MKQLQIVAPEQAEWKDVDVPTPGTGEVLLKIHAITTCPHWDLHLMSGESMFPGGRLTYPITPGQPGHELVADVVELGPGVKDLYVGARVADWQDRGGDVILGGYAQFVPFAAKSLIEVSNDLEPEAIASLELAMCLQVTFDRLLDRGGLEGKSVAIGGLGPAGILGVQLARAWGAGRVVAVDPVAERRQLALDVGADAAVEPTEADFVSSEEGPVDISVDCAGAAASVEFLMDHTKDAVALFGVLRDDAAYGWRHWCGHLDIIGYGRHNIEAAQRALALIEDGRLDLRPIVTHTLPLSRYAEGVELLRSREALKVCYLPWEE